MAESSFCAVAKPILYAFEDFVRHPGGGNDSLLRVKEHNAVWKALCGEPPT